MLSNGRLKQALERRRGAPPAVPPTMEAADSAHDAGHDTKHRILDAAETLFGEHGYGATSLRAITSAAGVNVAAVHYHFGGKQQLLEAVFARRVDAVNAERLERLDELERAHPEGPPLAAVLEAFFAPVVGRVASDDPGWRRFTRALGRLLGESGEHVAALQEVFAVVRRRFFPAFRRAVPHVDEASIVWRVQFLLGSMCHVLSDPARTRELTGGVCDPLEAEVALAQLVRFAEGALAAPPVCAPAAQERT